jgi:hypothetical protein
MPPTSNDFLNSDSINLDNEFGEGEIRYHLNILFPVFEIATSKISDSKTFLWIYAKSFVMII